MKPQELKARTKAIALAVIQLGEDIPRTKAADVIYHQLLRASSSVGANYRARVERAQGLISFQRSQLLRKKRMKAVIGLSSSLRPVWSDTIGSTIFCGKQMNSRQYSPHPGRQRSGTAQRNPQSQIHNPK